MKRIVEITHPEKILIPGISKADIISYYEQISPLMLPFLKNRPLMMHRFPEGITGESFYQKSASDYFPEWIETKDIPKEGGYTHFVICQNKETLLYLANQATITFHGWDSTLENLEMPDRIVFDLDPSRDTFSEIITVAQSLKDLLDSCDLTSFVMTTGSRGLHIHIPLARRLNYEQVKAFALNCAQVLIQKHPDLCTLEIRKEKRAGKIFIDTLRNQFGATAVVPYSIRALPKAPIATPLSWNEVKKGLEPQQYTIFNIFERVKKVDPWKDYFKKKQSISKASKKIQNLIP